MQGNKRNLALCRPSDGAVAVLIACHEWYREEIGGSQKIATELAEYLSARGHRVFYVCGTRQRCSAGPAMARGVELWRYRIPSSRLPRAWRLLRQILGSYRAARNALRQAAVTCVNGHTPLQFLGASLAARRACTRHVYSVHSPFAEELAWASQSRGAAWHRRTAAGLAGSIERMNCCRADRIQCYSRWVAELLGSEFGPRVAEKTVVTPGWVDVAAFRPPENIAGTRRRLGGPWDTADPIFFCLRRLEPRMGVEELVRAAKGLSDQGFRFRVLIGGAGPLELQLRRLAGELRLGEHVFVLGRIPDEELPLCFAAADCFVLPTRALECFGLVILEAYACGTPVIATPVGAIPELVGQHGREWLAAGIESRDIAERMAAFLRRDLAAGRSLLRQIAERYRSEAGLAALSQVVLGGAGG